MAELKEDLVNKNGFVITINDGFCTWEYTLLPENTGLCINDIITTLNKKFKSPCDDGKLIKGYFKK